MIIRNSSSEKFDIIILAGQSNAESSGKGETPTPWQPREDIMILKNDFVSGIGKTEEGFDYIVIDAEKDAHVEIADEWKGENARGMFALNFAKRYANTCLESGRKVLIVHTAVGGTGFTRKHWGIGDCLYNRMIDMCDSALKMGKDNKVVAVLWHQGEHDVPGTEEFDFDYTYGFYREKFYAFIKSVRDRYGKDIPVIAGGFCNEWASKWTKQCKAVIDATKKVGSELGEFGFVETDDLKSNNQMNGDGDDIHFCRASLGVLGERYFDEYEKIINK
jgi:hypothetical protein